MGVEQTISQNCLILRQPLDLAFVLLGNDFLKQNSVNIAYHSSDSQPVISINNKEVSLLSSSPANQSYFISSCLAFPEAVSNQTGRFQIAKPFPETDSDRTGRFRIVEPLPEISPDPNGRFHIAEPSPDTFPDQNGSS